MTMRFNLRLFPVLGMGLLVCAGPVGSAGELPTNNDPRRQIRFSTLQEAEERRRKLIRTIWPEGLPLAGHPAVRAK
ncbi:MAG: hypothetical protein GWO24_32915, partial [Akkermansiaceae bacterium]|nr:hypothetical protein [Akkermansiaceae bacterium]